MALVSLARKLQRKILSHFLFSQTLTPIHSLQPFSVSKSPHFLNFFSQSFHRTPSVHSQNNPQNPISPTLNPSHIPKSYYTVDVNQMVGKFANRDVSKLVELLTKSGHSEWEEAVVFLDQCGVKASEDLVVSAIWVLREEWKFAYFVFKWGEEWKCVGERGWCLMVWVLGNHKKFNTAWCLIRDLHRCSMDAQQALLIMMDRYAAANEPAEAIRTFQIMERFKTSPNQNALYTLLDVLCRNGNIEEAEEFMLQNKKLFPLETEGFNIILNGWCNICVDVFEAKRIWRNMAKCCITPDATTYTHMISCYSKVHNLFDSLRLYDEMKRRGWVPGREIYSSLIYVLAREDCLKEALRILDRMKEAGLQPDPTSYNNIICPLCELEKWEDARSILSKMLAENIRPTIDTYHAFLVGASFEETLEILKQLGKAGIGPSKDTFLVILSKFLKLGQPQNALKIWVEMKARKVSPESAHYTLMVEGLIKCGSLDQARETYAEMISRGLTDEPKLKKLLEKPKENSNRRRVGQRGNRKVNNLKGGTKHHPAKKAALGNRHSTQPKTNPFW